MPPTDPAAGNGRQTAADLKRILREVEEFYRTGQQISEKLGRRSRFHDLEREAGSHNAAVKLRYARTFAQAYSRQEFEELCETCRRYGYAPGTSLVSRLASIPKGQRKKLQLRAIKEQWSFNQLMARVRGNCVLAKAGAGRPMQKPRDLSEALFKLERICHQWVGLYQRLSQPVDRQKLKLPPELWRQIESAHAGISKLEAALKTRLKPGVTCQTTRKKK